MISLTPLGSDHFPFLISPFLFSLSRPPFFPLPPLDRPRAILGLGLKSGVHVPQNVLEI